MPPKINPADFARVMPGEPPRHLDDAETKRLAKQFGNQRSTEPDDGPGGVPKEVWPEMLKATAGSLAKRRK